MSELTPNLGFTTADGTDTFDNDKYIKGNFQWIDGNMLPKTKTIQTNAALKAELVTVTITASGTASSVQTSFNFANTYTNPPTVIPANIVQPESFVDAMDYPYIFSTTVTGSNVKLTTAGGSSFGAGAITINFLVIGS